MNRGQLKTRTQISLYNHRLVNAVIIKNSAHSFNPFLTARKHHYLNTGLLPTLHLRFQHIHLAMEILHSTTDKSKNVLRLNMRNLT
ncbi:hypothetical protein D3C75_604510 [compost metagenome]